MSSAENILKITKIFGIKTAMLRGIIADDLNFLDREDRDYVKRMGVDIESPMNPPPFIADKDIWKRAKKIVKKHWKKYSEPYAIVTYVYENMGGKIKKKKKKSYKDLNNLNKFANHSKELEGLISQALIGNHDAFLVFLDALEENKPEYRSQFGSSLLKNFRLLARLFPNIVKNKKNADHHMIEFYFPNNRDIDSISFDNDSLIKITYNNSPGTVRITENDTSVLGLNIPFRGNFIVNIYKNLNSDSILGGYYNPTGTRDISFSYRKDRDYEFLELNKIITTLRQRALNDFKLLKEGLTI